MRPSILFPLFAPLTSLPGLGPRLGKLAERLTGPHIIDLLWHLPNGLIDRRFAPKVAEAPAGRIATLTVTVDDHQAPASPRQPWRIRCRDETGFLELVFFHVHPAWLEKHLPLGRSVVVSGRIELFNDIPKISHPDYIGPAEDHDFVATVEPVYPLTTGITPKVLRKAIAAAFTRTPELPEWLDPALKAREAWPDWRVALASAHAPADESDLSPENPARTRLAYDELLANQLALALVRASQRRLPGIALTPTGMLRAKVLAALPYHLTAAQNRSLAEIDGDLTAPRRMLRLLQGDVGSGKTIVAFLAMLSAIETGSQAALMAPTEILARQHVATLTPLAEAAGIRIGSLTGRDKGKNRERLCADIAAGAIDLVIGTHTLFQDDILFHDLAVVVIDEQHRFGVHQRLALTAKGKGIDVLVMTATPIPRTLTLTAYGDMEVSRLDEKPPGRQPIKTATIALDRLDEVVDGLIRRLDSGARAYWVCPLIEESETLDLAAVTERFAALQQRLGPRVGLVHGRMKAADKDRVMEQFANGAIDLLVATTVIEVGVNVPEATVMVIEHAERFGLAQLHQMRGRVGRGQGASTCLLLYDPKAGATARSRLAALKDTEDGFAIAEADLRLRGAGELLGTRQSGLPEFRLADLSLHGALLAIARDDAQLIVHRDPDLESGRGAALRILLYLFERDTVIRNLRSG
ncbi:MAG: ATP-dependent DNA helicase RecG [Azospirillaceae bacterium]|nr:ATP-dependent DNA helicase RecG [Azospirillaceae bacterium]